jgi:hypothetical protein
MRAPAIVAPGEELPAGPRVSPARIWIADVGGEKFDVAPGRRFALGGDQRRDQRTVDRGRERAGLEDRGKMGIGGRHSLDLAQISCMIKDVIMREIGGERAAAAFRLRSRPFTYSPSLDAHAWPARR